ncbi:MAG: palindromic element RPE4 domain-containing protein [Rickettsia conorii subsp. raoultii]
MYVYIISYLVSYRGLTAVSKKIKKKLDPAIKSRDDKYTSRTMQQG